MKYGCGAGYSTTVCWHVRARHLFFFVPAAVWQGVQKFVMEDDVCFWTIVSLLFHVKTSSIVS